jgi:multidrug efflux pump
MFREFALTLTIAVVVSAIVSLTLTPMMCAKLLRRGHMESDRPGRFTRLVDVTVGAYHRSLLLVLRHQPATLIVTALTLVATIMLYVAMPKGFLPQQDTGLIVAVMEAGPEVSFAEMERLQGQVIAAVKADHDVTGTVAVAGVSPLNPTPNVARITIALKPRNERTAVVGEIIPRLQALVAPIAGVKLYFSRQDIRSAPGRRAQYQYAAGTSAAGSGNGRQSSPNASRASRPSPTRRRRKAVALWSRSTAGRGLGVSMPSPTR